LRASGTSGTSGRSGSHAVGSVMAKAPCVPNQARSKLMAANMVMTTTAPKCTAAGPA
jgi:hypothetical protein